MARSEQAPNEGESAVDVMDQCSRDKTEAVVVYSVHIERDATKAVH